MCFGSIPSGGSAGATRIWNEAFVRSGAGPTAYAIWSYFFCTEDGRSRLRLLQTPAAPPRSARKAKSNC